MRSRFSFSVATLAGMLLPALAFGAAGDLDTTFANQGRVALGTYSTGDKVALQSDGKIVATMSNGFRVVRFTSGGVLDATFGSGGFSDNAFPTGGSPSDVVIQPDGMIVVVGYFVVGTSGDFAVARFDSAGYLDATFGSGGTVTTAFGPNYDSANAVALQADGKIVVAGLVNQGAAPAFGLVRYESNGSLDAGFGAGGLVTNDVTPNFDSAFDVVVEPSGAILVGGLSSAGLGTSPVLVRYDAAGALDASFGSGGVAPQTLPPGGQIWGIALQADGKILVSGVGALAVARLDDTGALDPTFGEGGAIEYPGIAPVGFAYDIAVQPNGSIVLAGSVNGIPDRDFIVARVLPNGRIDPTFAGGKGALLDINGGDNVGQGLAIQPDGNIVITGTAEVAPNDYRLALARFLGNGPCEPGPAPDGDGDVVCDAGDGCQNVAGARNFVADPAPELEQKYTFGEEGKDSLTLRATFDLPTPGDFSNFDPIANGAHFVLRAAGDGTLIDAVLPGGAFAGKGTAGWRSNGPGTRWKFIDRTGAPVEGIAKMEFRDRSKAAPGRVAVKLSGRHATYQLYPGFYPLSATVVLGGAGASTAGLCGEGVFQQ
jgi:uncharacterized delta-60 repeat protein